jgi:hypothetical protein
MDKVNNVSMVTTDHFYFSIDSRKYISYWLVAKELWLRKQTSPSSCALGIGLFYCHNSLAPVYNYNVIPGDFGALGGIIYTQARRMDQNSIVDSVDSIRPDQINLLLHGFAGPDCVLLK